MSSRQKINDLFRDPETVAHGHNKIYKRFRKVFEVLLEEASPTVWRANPEARYVDLPEMDDQLEEVTDTLVSSIVPLTGYTGIGKSTLVRHFFKSTGAVEVRDKRLLIPMFFNSRFNIREALLTSMKAACRLMQEHASAPFSIEAFAEFVYANRPDLLFYDETVPINLAKPQLLDVLLQKYPEGYYMMYLKFVRRTTPISQILIIVDDIESQEFAFQEAFLKQVFKAYKCICNDPHREFTVNVLIALRPSTLKLLSKQVWYTAYPVREPVNFDKAVCLEDLFKERFDYYVEKQRVLDAVENKESWMQAYEILQSIARKVSSRTENVLVPLCNCNVREALKQVTRILTNKRWFEKPEAARSPIVNMSDYRFSESALFRSIALHNFGIYTGKDTPVKNILRNTIDPRTDLMVTYVIRFLQIAARTENEFRVASKKQLMSMFEDVFGGGEATRRIVEEALRYMHDCELLEAETTADGLDHLTLLPRAECLIKMLQDSAVLLELFRDDAFQDFNRQELVAPTTKLSDDLFWALAAMFAQICATERRHLERCKEAGLTQAFKNIFGPGLLSTLVYTGLRDTSRLYYPSGDTPNDVRRLVDTLHEFVAQNQMLLEG